MPHLDPTYADRLLQGAIDDITRVTYCVTEPATVAEATTAAGAGGVMLGERTLDASDWTGPMGSPDRVIRLSAGGFLGQATDVATAAAFLDDIAGTIVAAIEAGPHPIQADQAFRQDASDVLTVQDLVTAPTE